MRVDVLVAGGGSAGLAAAVSAARSGARTLLVERHGSLGGMATAALVHSVCGLYRLSSGPEAVPANPGLATELAARLLAGGGASGPARLGRVDVLLHRPPAFAAVADRLAADERTLEVRLHSEVIEATIDPAGASVEISCRGRREEAVAAVVVDATGDAAIAALCGAPHEIEASDRLQRPAFIFALGGVAEDALSGDRRLRLAHRIAAATRTGALPSGAMGASLREGGPPGEAYVTIDLAGPPGALYDPLDPRCLTALEVYGRALAAELADFLARGIDGFARCYVAALPARVGVRESRRVIGEHRLEASDLEEGASFPDSVALATWPMEMRETAAGARLRFPASDRPCEIPLRSLRARSQSRLLAAGRCIAASHPAQASIRVIGTCLATGEAAGIAAALIADGFRAPLRGRGASDSSLGSPGGETADETLQSSIALAREVRRQRAAIARPAAGAGPGAPA